MTWKCPACTTAIAHHVDDEQKNIRYRCPVCRLGLLWDRETQAFIVVADEGVRSPLKPRITPAA